MRRFRHAARAFCLVTVASATTVAAPKSPRAAAQEVLQGLAEEKADAAISAEPIAHAKDALDRARSLRNTGDKQRGALLERVARQWAHVARDLVRAAIAERRADDAEQQLKEAETRVVRAQALLEETMARRGRAAAALAEVEGQTPDGKPDEGSAGKKGNDTQHGAPQDKELAP